MFTSGFGTCVRLPFGNSSRPATAAPTIPICIDHIAVPSNEPSTSPPSPVFALCASAAAIPPASPMPLSESPNAPAGMPIGGWPVGVTDADTEPRDQKLIES